MATWLDFDLHDALVNESVVTTRLRLFGNRFGYPVIEQERSHFKNLFQDSITRLRSALTTALVASPMFVSMAIATGTGTGAEVQRFGF